VLDRKVHPQLKHIKEKRVVDEAQSRLNCLNEMKDEDPFDWSLHSNESYVDVQHLMSTLEVVD